jgi:hypothetical protein
MLGASGGVAAVAGWAIVPGVAANRAPDADVARALRREIVTIAVSPFCGRCLSRARLSDETIAAAVLVQFDRDAGAGIDPTA